MKINKILLLILPLLITVTGCGEKAAETIVNGQRYYSMAQGFGFMPSRQDAVGYITYLKIGDTVAAADFNVADPLNITTRLKVCGVVSWLTWRQGANDPVVFAAQVSGANKDKLAALGKTDLTDIAIEFGFTLYDYDLKTRAYYKMMNPAADTLKGTLYKQDEYLLFLMSTDPSAVVSDPENYTFQIGVKGTGGGQKIMITESQGKAAEKGWGNE
jgi:hypothetical protein